MKNKVEKLDKGNPVALIPLFVFLVLYLGMGIYFSMQGVEMAFYQFPAPIAALVGIIVAFFMASGSMEERVSSFIKGAGENNVIIMCMIYLLAGAFSAVSQAVGGVDATVNLGLSIIPSQFLLPGLFLIAAFIATAMGTSMGTIGAVVPIAVGIASKAALPLPLTISAVIGGAMFGDNLSIISDTTIAATQTQGVEMRDKFKMNLLIVLPAAIITLIFLFFVGDTAVQASQYSYEIIKVVPYIAVLVFALIGVNVFMVLFGGMLLSGLIGIIFGDFTFIAMAQEAYAGFNSMTEVFFLSMFAGGLAAMIRKEGGLQYLIYAISSRIKNTKGAELGIAALVSVTDVCTANNTVAIIISGPLARNIAIENNVDLRRSASLLDIFACVWQGIIPYGAQILLAGSLAKISPIQIIPNLHYNFLVLIAGLLAIYFAFPSADKLFAEKAPAQQKESA
ncbi:Na+/H+ antiporter NhaC [Halanaerobium congolense]|jgi:Na+/H+ antiporter NhaC|uniref:Na+/H+ antiporter NhaC n=1 Tax=Halanaerobium congolense TaxID=54121 RepID=A0A1M7MXP8_9FIRM|nr:Na+/H+ antiporter NhaC family protein [Halanaerobium congolense]TDX46423.1 Na+/H+ antiporter NhaC [Halanaerobium congolense]SDJ16527.1 Na+/H+ antiporter NhaC [Halanaerobium congolense]SET72494.1 Na+/H+ antiporter NhaC [Halanaerobium congolense]SHM95848.1 Na+/H+ antiporter NhaC [Halanaerobium congolense]